MLTTLLTFGLLTWSSPRGLTGTYRSPSIFDVETWFLDQIWAKSKGYPMVASIYQKCAFLGGPCISRKYRELSKNESHFWEAAAVAMVYCPTNCVWPRWDRTGRGSSHLLPKVTHQGPLIELSLGSIVLKRPTVVTISGPLSLGGRAHDQMFWKKCQDMLQ